MNMRKRLAKTRRLMKQRNATKTVLVSQLKRLLNEMDSRYTSCLEHLLRLLELISRLSISKGVPDKLASIGATGDHLEGHEVAVVRERTIDGDIVNHTVLMRNVEQSIVERVINRFVHSELASENLRVTGMVVNRHGVLDVHRLKVHEVPIRDLGPNLLSWEVEGEAVCVGDLVHFVHAL